MSASAERSERARGGGKVTASTSIPEAAYSAAWTKKLPAAPNQAIR